MIHKITEKLIAEIDTLIQLIQDRIGNEARRRGFGGVQGSTDIWYFSITTTYKNLDKIRTQLSAPLQENFDLNLIFQAQQTFHQRLTDNPSRKYSHTSFPLTNHLPEDFRSTSGFLFFKYFYWPLSGLFQWIDFLILEKLLNNFF